MSAARMALYEAVVKAARRQIKKCDCGRNPMYPESQVPHRYECATMKNDPDLVAAIAAYDETKK